MKISIFGLGYVGVVSASLLSQKFKVIGVDINQKKVSMINEGKSPIIEKDVENYISKAISEGKLKATLNSKKAILETDISIICVGTPSNKNGSHDLNSLNKVLHQISTTLKQKEVYHCVIIRSTVPPGTMDEFHKRYFKDKNLGFCFNPEFLREGSAISDYLNPPFIIAACNDEKSKSYIKRIYEDISKEITFVNYKEAETIKLLSNVFHALKISFANEVGRFCSKFNIDAKKVMSVLCKDTQLNISDAYLKPGFAFGGSCLPKDLRSFIYLAKINDVNIPMISNIINSNEKHIKHYIDKIQSYGKKNLGFVGLSFKQGTDDLRESPYLRLVEYFIGKGYDIKIYDKDIILSRLMGKNKEFLEEKIPHINSLIVDNIQELKDRDIIVSNREIWDHFNNKIIINLG